MGDTTVKDMVMAVMENPRVACKRSAARQMWESVQLLAEDFASSAILGTFKLSTFSINIFCTHTDKLVHYLIITRGAYYV